MGNLCSSKNKIDSTLFYLPFVSLFITYRIFRDNDFGFKSLSYRKVVQYITFLLILITLQAIVIRSADYDCKNYNTKEYLIDQVKYVYSLPAALILYQVMSSVGVILLIGLLYLVNKYYPISISIALDVYFFITFFVTYSLLLYININCKTKEYCKD